MAEDSLLQRNIWRSCSKNADLAYSGYRKRRRQSMLRRLARMAHLGRSSFREVVPMHPYSRLNDFCQRFGRRASAESTPHRFDQ
jgi:hypothetical protein